MPYVYTKYCVFCEDDKDENGFDDPCKWRTNFKHRCADCREAQKKKSTHNKRIWARAKDRAFDKKIPFDIEPEDIIIPTHCPVLGFKLVGPGSACRNEVASLDRFDPALGYVKGNIEVISYRANVLKNNGTIEEHEKLVAWMKERQAKPDFGASADTITAD